MTPRSEQTNYSSSSEDDEVDDLGGQQAETISNSRKSALVLTQHHCLSLDLTTVARARRPLGLIFDLDGTLVAELADDNNNNDSNNNGFLPDEIFLRPGVLAFLRWCRSRGHALAIWTAAHASWAHYVSWKLSSSSDSSVFDFVWDGTKLRKRRRIPVDAHGLESGSCRWCGPYKHVCDRCTCGVGFYSGGGVFQCPCRSTKDLTKVWRRNKQEHGLFSRERTLLIENTPQQCLNNYGNAVYVPTYTGCQEDRILARLQELIVQLECVPDIRCVNKCNCGKQGRHACMEQSWWWSNSNNSGSSNHANSSHEDNDSTSSSDTMTCQPVASQELSSLICSSSSAETSSSSSSSSFENVPSVLQTTCAAVTSKGSANDEVLQPCTYIDSRGI